MPTKTDLTGILDKIHENIEGDEICLKNIVGSLRHRGYGPLLIVPTIFSLLPTGALPGIPLLMGLIIVFISLQMIIGKKQPWIPKRVLDMSIKKEKFEKGRNFLIPYTNKIDHYIKPRLRFLSSNFSNHFIGITCLTLGASMPILGLVPFGADIPGLVVFLYALGLSTRDGYIISLAIAANVGAYIASYFIILNILAG